MPDNHNSGWGFFANAIAFVILMIAAIMLRSWFRRRMARHRPRMQAALGLTPVPPPVPSTCTRCGRPAAAGAQFCPVCGAPLPYVPPSRRVRPVFMWIVILAMAAIAMGILWSLNSPSARPATPQDLSPWRNR